MESITTRGIEKKIKLNASKTAVWQALTNAEELMRWFPHLAEVDPGAGGKIKLQWGENHIWELRITAWEEEKYLRLEYEQGADYKQLDDQEKASLFINSKLNLAVDYILEEDNDTTVLRLVHYGFSSESDWDDLYDGVSRGWSSELQNLKIYLENHYGKNRSMIYLAREAKMSQEDIWSKLMGHDGFRQGGSTDDLVDNQRYKLHAADGQVYEGTVYFSNPPLDFVGVVENYNNAMLRVKSDFFGKWPEAFVILCSYGISEDDTRRFEEFWSTQLEKLFPA